MNSYFIFYPMGALAALTAFTIVGIAFTRFWAVGRGRISENFYRLFQGEGRPELEAKVSRHYANLVELPVLFYVAGLGIFAAKLVDETFLILFWVYVAVRVVHAVVHVTYNRPLHRAAVFGLGVAVLVVIWVRFLTLLSTNAGGA